jgi:hypothetical protein
MSVPEDTVVYDTPNNSPNQPGAFNSPSLGRFLPYRGSIRDGKFLSLLELDGGLTLKAYLVV